MTDLGLIDFYSAQADLMLTQYKNINHLLGPTHDWTAPGTLCEVLLRDLVRRSLPSRFSVDKGFAYGRDVTSDAPTHCPEIDILIHDTLDYRPLFRLDDFVIVEPEAVRGVIQVKRTLTSATLKTALDNIRLATEHLRKHRQYGFQLSQYYSAVVGFEEGIGLRADNKVSETYANLVCPTQLSQLEASWLPDFIGTLDGLHLLHTGENIKKIGYQCIKARQADKNIAVQDLLVTLSRKVFPFGQLPRFSFPDHVKVEDYIPLYDDPS